MKGTMVRDSGIGYGFIRVLGAERDVFVHVNDTGGVIPPVGTRVEFECIDGPKGPRALSLVVIDEAA